MAIQPIDLQTLFTQVEQVGKNQSAQREGLQIQAGIQGMEIQRKAGEQIRAVNEAQDAGDGAEGVKDRAGGGGSGGERRGGGEGREEEEAPAARGRTIRDPALGRNVDFSG